MILFIIAGFYYTLTKIKSDNKMFKSVQCQTLCETGMSDSIVLV
jgi:hypothetical protein